MDLPISEITGRYYHWNKSRCDKRCGVLYCRKGISAKSIRKIQQRYSQKLNKDIVVEILSIHNIFAFFMLDCIWGKLQEAGPADEASKQKVKTGRKKLKIVVDRSL